jgi:hypothetical protein
MCLSVPLSAQRLDAPVKYQARDSIRYDLATGSVHLFGAGTVTYGDVVLTADRIILDTNNEEAQAFGALDSSGTVVGKPTFVQDGHTIEAQHPLQLPQQAGPDPRSAHPGAAGLGACLPEQAPGQ